MKVLIRTLPRAPNALGGEDQIGFMLQEGFERLGHSCAVCFDKVRQEADLVVCMGLGEPAPHRRSMLWCFNESFDVRQADQLGYGIVATNSVDPARYGLPYAHLPLAGHRSMLPVPDAEMATGGIAYIGNWSNYKQTSIDKYLVPLAKLAGTELMIFGGSGWTKHPELHGHYRGMLHPHSWPYLRSIAQTWVAFRSEAQGAMGMMPDRVYNLVAAGVQAVVTDGPVEPELASMVAVHDDPEQWCSAALSGLFTGCAQAGPDLVRTTGNYDDRARRILELCAGM